MNVVQITFEPVPEWLQDELKDEVEKSLTSLHIPKHFDGYRYFTFAIALNIENPERVRYITKDIYPDTAMRFRSTVSRVERAMRTAVRVCWLTGGRETLNQMAGYHLIQRPSNSQFIKIVSGYMRRR